ncbi:MAG: autotransporter-associated beta strand repeat-containing protein [Pirellulales bacterium]
MRASALTIGSAETADGTGIQGSMTANFTMGAGILRAESMTIGRIAGAGSIAGAFGTTGMFTLNHPAGVVEIGNLVLGENSITASGTSAKSVSGTFALTSGTLKAATIQRGVQTGNATTITTRLNWTTGKIQNLDALNLTILDVPITLLTNGTHEFRATSLQNIRIAGSSTISGTGFGIQKTGPGVLTIATSSVNSYTGSTAIYDGTLELDSTNLATPTNLLSSSSGLQLGGGTLSVIGKPASSTSQTFSGLQVLAGDSAIKVVNDVVPGSTAVLKLGSITRAVRRRYSGLRASRGNAIDIQRYHDDFDHPDVIQRHPRRLGDHRERLGDGRFHQHRRLLRIHESCRFER